MVEEEGYGALTMERIAKSASVSKQTVYRWWPSKAEVVLEVLNEAAQAMAPAPDTGFWRPACAASCGGRSRK